MTAKIKAQTATILEKMVKQLIINKMETSRGIIFLR